MKLNLTQRIALDALDDALVFQGVITTWESMPPCKAVLVEYWRRHAYKKGIADADTQEARKKAFQRIRRDLQDKGLIRIYDDHVWKTDRREISRHVPRQPDFGD